MRSTLAVMITALFLTSCADEGCPTGFMDLGGICYDLQTDDDHCGDCNTACTAPHTACQAGQCDCAPGYHLCGTACVDLQTNVLHCGVCDNDCKGNKVCVGGECI